MASRCPTTNWWLSQADRHEGASPVPVTVPPWNRLVRVGMAVYPGSMSKDQNKKRTAKTNKPKLTAKEKKLKKLAKKGK